MNSRKHIYALIIFLFAIPIHAQQIEWFTDYKTAAAAAKESGKPILMDFTADWCKPCKVMEASFWVKPNVIELSERFVCVKIDFDDQRSFAHKYGVRGIPNVIFTDSWGTPLLSHLGFGRTAESEIVRKMDLVPGDFSELKDAFAVLDADKNDLAALSKFAAFYEQAKFFLKSNEFNNRILKLETDATRRENLVLKMGINYLKNNLQDEALEMFEKFQREFPESPQMEKVFFAQIVAYERKDKMKNAQKTLAQLKTKFPESIYMPEAEKLIAQHAPKK